MMMMTACAAMGVSTEIAAATSLTPLDYRFAGTVTSVSSAVTSEFSVGEAVRGRLTVNPTFSTPIHGGGQVTSLTANIGGDYPISSSLGGFDVLNNFGGFTDLVKVDANTFTGLMAPRVNGLTAEYFSINLLYNGAGPLTTSDFLPQFVMGSIDQRSVLRFNGNDAWVVRFQLTDLSVIPEPSAAALMILSVAGVVIRRRRTTARRLAPSGPRA
jgi:hypothetical protein